MKKLLYIFLLFTQVFHAQNGFVKGNEFYKKGNYTEAVSAYESVAKKSKKQSAELFFNLGNAYYKLNQVAPAVFNYEKALLLKPNDAEIQNNLKYAQKLAIDDIKEKPKVGFRKMLRDLTGTYWYDTWAWIAVAGSGLFLVLFIGYYFASNTLVKRLFFIGMFLALILIVISILSAVFEKNAYQSDRPAVVFAESVSVKAEPKSNAKESLQLHEGTKVYVLEEKENWRKVALPDERKGWIDAGAIRELK